jgi:hypothetical protein
LSSSLVRLDHGGHQRASPRGESDAHHFCESSADCRCLPPLGSEHLRRLIHRLRHHLKSRPSLPLSQIIWPICTPSSPHLGPNRFTHLFLLCSHFLAASDCHLYPGGLGHEIFQISHEDPRDCSSSDQDQRAKTLPQLSRHQRDGRQDRRRRVTGKSCDSGPYPTRHQCDQEILLTKD